jgi:hypothetical protein
MRGLIINVMSKLENTALRQRGLTCAEGEAPLAGLPL